jgi:bifunctional non-homologous end joining protein LigD
MALPRSITRFNVRVLPGVRTAPYPGFVEPQLATLKREVPAGSRWIHEIKFDGFRIQAHLVKKRVHLYTRSGLDWTDKFRPIDPDIGRLKANHAIIDGEVISEVDGIPSFSALQSDLSTGRDDRLLFYAFDLLFLDGFDLRGVPLLERKRVLAEFLAEAGPSRVVYSTHWEEHGEEVYRNACKMKLEGTISKLRDAPYVSERNESWIKNKCVQRGVFFVVGFVPKDGGHLGAIHLAKKEGKAFRYIGKAGTGFTQKSSREVRAKLEPFARPTPATLEKLRVKDTTWIEPKLKAEIEYTEFTNDGTLRHPSFKGLR